MEIVRNGFALLTTFAVILIWLRVCDFAAHRGWISSDLHFFHAALNLVFVRDHDLLLKQYAGNRPARRTGGFEKARSDT